MCHIHCFSKISYQYLLKFVQNVGGSNAAGRRTWNYRSRDTKPIYETTTETSTMNTKTTGVRSSLYLETYITKSMDEMKWFVWLHCDYWQWTAAREKWVKTLRQQPRRPTTLKENRHVTNHLVTKHQVIKHGTTRTPRTLCNVRVLSNNT